MDRDKPRRRNSRSKLKRREFQVLIEQDEGNWFVAECPALKGCYTQGKSYAEVLRNIRDVIELCLDELKAQGVEVPKPAEIIAVRTVEVQA